MITFTKVKLDYGWLGNMSPYSISYEDKEWRTAESLFQALRFDDDEIREMIRLEHSPMGAKMKAKKYADKMVVEPMSDKDVGNMELIIRLKIEQHPELKEKLLETGDEIIAEDVSSRSGHRHLFWGMSFKDNKWTGENTLGKIWMKIRSEIKYS